MVACLFFFSSPFLLLPLQFTCDHCESFFHVTALPSPSWPFCFRSSATHFTSPSKKEERERERLSSPLVMGLCQCYWRSSGPLCSPLVEFYSPCPPLSSLFLSLSLLFISFLLLLLSSLALYCSHHRRLSFVVVVSPSLSLLESLIILLFTCPGEKS